MSAHFKYPAVVLTIAALAACAPDPQRPESRQLQMNSLLEKFDRFDTNGDGSLTRRELGDGVKELGTLQLSEAELDTAMNAYDTNRNRRISHSEARRAAARGPVIFTDR